MQPRAEIHYDAQGPGCRCARVFCDETLAGFKLGYAFHYDEPRRRGEAAVTVNARTANGHKMQGTKVGRPNPNHIYCTEAVVNGRDASMKIDGRVVSSGRDPLASRKLGNRICLKLAYTEAKFDNVTVVGRLDPKWVEEQFEALSRPAPNLPEGLASAFVIPWSDWDQYHNLVATRDGRKCDPVTGWPYEIWLKEPRMEFALIPAGEFMMGSPANEKGRTGLESPMHRVRISKSFYLAKYEITQSAYQAVVGKNPSMFKGKANPVEKVCWRDAKSFCRKLAATMGVGVRLPTEAEWEYACRAGTQTAFSYGDDPAYARLGQYAWYERNSGGRAHGVGQKKPNPWSLYDMHGNVWEWCLDGRAKYPISRRVDPRDPDDGFPSLRGGAWNREAELCRSAFRNRCRASDVRPFHGFRVLLELPSPK